MATFTYEEYAYAFKSATFTGTTTFSGPVNVGVNDTGYDFKMFGATSGSYWLWDESADGVVQIGTLTIGADDAGHDVIFYGATASRYWQWDESADGVVQRGTLTVGVDDTGHDVKFFGATSGSYMLWDESDNSLQLTDSTPIKIGDGQDFTLYHDGSHSYVTNGGSGGNLIFDVADTIILDAGDGDIYLKDDGTQFGALRNTSGNLFIQSGSTTAATFSGANVTLAGTVASGAITSSGDVTAFSDSRLKTDIKTIDNALNKVCDMRGVYFNRDGVAGTGVIAQEVENILPQVVKEGEYKSVAYGNMVGILIESIKELKKEVETLKEAK